MGKSNSIKATSYAEQFKLVIPDEASGLRLLADIKWKDGFLCSKCGNTNFCKGKSDFSRICTRCKKDESATSNTIFHRCKIPINMAMEIAYLVCNVTDISSYEISRQLDMRHMTCYGFKKKIAECNDGKRDDKLMRSLLSIIQERIVSQSN